MFSSQHLGFLSIPFVATHVCAVRAVRAFHTVGDVCDFYDVDDFCDLSAFC